MTTAATFQIQYSRFIDSSGQEVAQLPPSIDDDSLVEFYRDMVFCRAFDKKAVALQRTGRLSTYAPLIGQEAIDVGIAHALEPTDVFLPYYRNVGAQILRGVSMVEQFLYFGGNERGCDFKKLAEDFPTQTPHAVGVAMAIKLRREQRAAVTTIGDGASSKGDFYEAMNLAGVWQVPLVFVAINNGWAISVPYESQTAAKTLAQKAIAAGIGSEQVDGNDVTAVHDGMRRALDRARSGEGPYLIDMETYRLGDHTTADNASRYRPDEEVSAAWKEDPNRTTAHVSFCAELVGQESGRSRFGGRGSANRRGSKYLSCHRGPSGGGNDRSSVRNVASRPRTGERDPGESVSRQCR